MLKQLQTVLSYHDVKHSYWQYYKQFLPLSDRNRDMHTANTVTVWVLQKYQIEKENIDLTGWVKIMTFVSFILSSCCHLPLLILLISAGSLFYLVSLSSLSFSVSLSQFFSFLPSFHLLLLVYLHLYSASWFRSSSCGSSGGFLLYLTVIWIDFCIGWNVLLLGESRGKQWDKYKKKMNQIT